MNAMMTMTRPDEALDLPGVLVEDVPETVRTESFQVDTMDKGIWAAGKIVQAQRSLEELERWARVFHDRIDAWVAKASKPHLDTVGYLGSLLRPFLADRLRGLRVRSLTLPGLRLGFRTSPSRVVVDDPVKALGYLEERHPEAIQVKREVLKTALKPLLSRGEAIPGVSLVEGDESLYVQAEE